MFAELVKIGNAAKDIENYELANKCFAVALKEYFRLDFEKREATEHEPPEVWLVWETQDEMGDYPPEVYYDLLVIETATLADDKSGYDLNRCCIPVPLLESFVAITALKCANITERRDHNRQTREAKEGELENLEAQLTELLYKNNIDDDFEDLVKGILVEEEEVEIVSRIAPTITGLCRECGSSAFEVEVTKQEGLNDLVVICCAKCGTAA